MGAKDSGRAAPTYRILSEDQIAALHGAILQVLEEVGVRVSHEEARQLLSENGCHVEGDIVRIHGAVVERCLRSAPSTVTIYDQTGEPAMELGGRRNYYGLGTDLIVTQDLQSGERHASTLRDVIDAARVSDACPNINFVASFALPGDVPTNAMYIACVKAQLENTRKPIFFTAAGKEDLAYIHRMVAAVVGGEDVLRAKPSIINYSEPTPPLTHSYGAVCKLFFCADKGIPICYTPAAMLGGSAPVTVPGALVQTGAEALSGIVLHQLRAPGAPIISGVATPTLDPRTMCVSYASPDMRMGNSAYSDLFHHYNLPIWSSAGSDAHVLDTQGAWENAMGILLASLDGANLIHDVAYLGQGLLGDPASIVLCDEIVSYVKHIIAGFEMNAETMATEAIRRVGPGGNYLADQHTVDHFRKVLWQPQMVNRANPDTWAAKGSLRHEERARRKALSILAHASARPLPEGVQVQLDALYEEAGRELANIHFTA